MGSCCSCCGSKPANINDGKSLPTKNTSDPRETSPPLPPSSRPLIVVGIHRYVTTDSKDVSFDKGDRMKVLEKKENNSYSKEDFYIDKKRGKWISVKHLSNMKCGLIPTNFVAPESSLESYDWFHDDITRKDAEILLLGDENQPKGTFLIRCSESDRSALSLSIKDYEQDMGNHVKHFKIQTINNGGYYISSSQDFKTLAQLVSAYSKRNHILDCRLLYPCEKPEPSLMDLSSTYRDKWEIRRDEIKLIKELGSGCFGKVYYGKWKDQYEIAVKTLKKGTMSKEEFLDEAKIMKTFRHRHLVQLYGVCTIGEPAYIVQEYMEKGNVKNYLRKDRGQSVKFEDLISIAFQVASGMAHLELLKYVHRDLAARNVLLSSKNIAKVCDFGLARIIDKKGYLLEGGQLPIKWTAPEALKHSLFTTSSDVWSYGILLMELFTYGETPYNGMDYKAVAEMIQAGVRMAKPKDYELPDQIYEHIMLKCWHEIPEKRPTFKVLAMIFEHMDVTYRNVGKGKSQIVIKYSTPNYIDQFR